MQCVLLFAQKEANIWYFGNYAGLNFNTNPPTALTNSVMSTFEGCTSIADKSGNLLFYSDGITVWNKNHQIMTNGTGLLGNSSSTQSALVINYPGIDSLYLLFTSGAFGSSNGVCYSTIDMKQGGSLGAVTIKNTKLVNLSAEKIAAINHANQRDIWVAIPAKGSDSIYTYLVTPSGVSLNAVKNTTGFPILNYNPGQMKFSNDAKNLAFVLPNNGKTIISNFNNSTGTISNTRTISGYNAPYGLEFSPNSQYLYISEEIGKLFQCLIPNLSTDKAINCKMIDSINYPNLFGQLQLAPDKHIYSVTNGKAYIGVINSPDNYYNSCDYIRNAIDLRGSTNKFGLPSFYQSYFSPIGFINSISSCLRDSSIVSMKIDTTSIDSINWYIGDTITPIIYGSKIKQFKYLSADTSTKIILAKVYSSSTLQKYYGSLITKTYPTFQLMADTTICFGDSIKLKATYSGAKYLWQDSTTDSTYLGKKSGLYWVKVDNKGCVKYDSVNIKVLNLPIVNIGNDTIICGAINYQINSNYPFAKSYLWSDNSTDSVLNINKNGDYWLIVNDSGCVNKDTVSIVLKAFPTINLGNDTIICQNKNLMLKANYSNANYLWSDGSKDSIFEVNKAGKYWLSINDSSCVNADTIEVHYKNLPIVNLGNDTTLCNNATLLLTAPSNYQSYLWNDLSKENTILVNKEGKYLVIVNDSGCEAQDQINIYYLNTPNVNLGNDTTICDAFPFYLKANSQKANYLWSNILTDSIIQIIQSGNYWVKVYNVCGTATDTAKIEIIACNCYMYLPNAFSPNGNNLNDAFLPISNCEMTHYQLQIFNRWGVQLFESTNPIISWDGKLNGVLQTNDVYTYQVQVDLVNSNKSAAVKHVSLKGNVTLLN
jgi:gliding motility-associated-like protein